MFYSEEDVLPVVKAANQCFGETNTYLHGKNVLKNITVATRDFGKIWFGDIFTETLDPACKRLSNLLQKDVFVFHSNEEFNFNNAIAFPYSTE